MEKKSKIIDAAIQYGVIEEKDRSIYMVAIPSLFFSFFTWSTLLLLGVIFKELYGCLMFLIFHIPLRVYAGGFHQNTRGRCYVQSIVIFLLLIFGTASAISEWLVSNWMILLFPAILVIWYLSPVEAVNKPLDVEERKHHKSVSRIILVIEVFVLSIFAFNNLDHILYFILVSIELVAIQLILGFVESKLVHSSRQKTH